MNSEWEPRHEWAKLLGGAALGAAAMYVFDPDKGKRRRALVRDKTRGLAPVRATHSASPHAMRRTGSRACGRARGACSRTLRCPTICS